MIGHNKGIANVAVLKNESLPKCKKKNFWINLILDILMQ
jgi:hypothetical protein